LEHCADQKNLRLEFDVLSHGRILFDAISAELKMGVRHDQQNTSASLSKIYKYIK
jgi:hypothetical protein